MTDMIEAVARAAALAANDYEGPDLQWHGWTDIAQAAITAHTAALIAGAGELGRKLRWWGEDGVSGDRRILVEAAATIAALQARAEAAEASARAAMVELNACKDALAQVSGTFERDGHD